ncbi:MAG: hypothetical protein COW00_12275 [Bdellovibrio sp. CG12_big_fil_rev_8_21_14_0_65_39_13]|nr:MAG: hypothetical protein COW78_03640 [Bdellovibrio sp. CG22_combo_CG10-13_8_21_14_all_39_27]PIQ59101.1 MAG: hypothetical protein COW00_12275 [Bdellovibrio sp. CG12_big_fil_rev_8_21_14_0_65_39_13]PIR35208.1 MAG: hypothetical protein COV37_09875 [Bdellovibrio sp. CG11_big_fil_rev_8_21_14_0_20_39_38]PJB52340.1 MAG: hypothetical protein CO099_13135 [Bdellovibrio sp. CG_4_9_14_3_um_filter_39_7]
MLKTLGKMMLIFALVTPVWGKVVLLTSLNPELNRPPLRSKKWNINEKLEKIFRDQMDNQEIEVIHMANQWQLYQALNDKDVQALLWVSHSSNTSDRTSDALSTASVLDHQFRDVLPLFQTIPSHIQYLGLVGCRSELIINELKSKNKFQSSAETKLFLEEKKVDARKSLKRALKELKQIKLKDEVEAKCIEQEVAQIDFTRTAIESDAASVRIVVGGQVLKVLPKLLKGETQTGTISVVGPIQSKGDLKILIDTGASSHSELDLGKFTFTNDHEAEWKLFAKPDGTPFGIGSQVYHLKTKEQVNEWPFNIETRCN